MITGHHFIKQANRDILVLELNFQYEVAGKSKCIKWKDQIVNYLRDHNIPFQNRLILLSVGGILLASFLFQSPVKENENLSFVNREIVLNLKEIPKSDQTIEETIDKIDKDSVSDVISSESSKQESSSTSSGNSNTVSNSFNQPNVQPDSAPTPAPSPSTPSLPVEEVNQTIVTVYRSNGAVLNIELETYLIGVVAAEMPASFSTEALKAQAVVARTYTLKCIQTGKQLTDTESTQVYYDDGQLRSMWAAQFTSYYHKIKEAVNATKGLTLVYQGQYIDAVYHSTNNGSTIAAKEVWGWDIPYLQPVHSPWDKSSPFYYKTVEKDFSNVLSLFGIAAIEEPVVEVMQRDPNGYVRTINLNGTVITAKNFRSKLGLSSTDFDLIYQNGILTISTRGWGHSVGMSQYGANGMAQEGQTFRTILQYYYPSTQFQTI